MRHFGLDSTSSDSELHRCKDEVTRYYDAYCELLGYVEELEESLALQQCTEKRLRRLISWLVKESGHD